MKALFLLSWSPRAWFALLQRSLEAPSKRWPISFVFVLALHAVIIATVLNWPSQRANLSAPPMAAMMIELAQAPVAPETPPSAAPVGAVQEEMQPSHEPLPALEEELLPELPIIEDAETVLPPEPEPIKENVEREPVEEQMAQEERAPQAFEAPPDEVAAAPMDGAVSLKPSQAKATWQSVLLGHLEHHKRYPREARRNRHEAIVYVRVKINRDGSVVDYRLEKDSVYQTLNQETLALIVRAEPLPPPPEDIVGETVEFVVPVEFFLRR